MMRETLAMIVAIVWFSVGWIAEYPLQVVIAVLVALLVWQMFFN